MTRIIPIEPSIPGEPKVPAIPGEPKAPDNTQRANYFLFFSKLPGKYYSVYIKMFLNNYHFYQIMTRIIPIEPSIPGEPKAPDNTQRAKSARQWRAKSAQYPESQKRQTIPGEPITLFFFQNCFENKKEASITQFT